MGLRSKLLLASLSLLVLPWAGWQFLKLVGDIVREGQEEALVASAEAMARGIAQRPAALPPSGPALYAQALPTRPRLDGRIDDWTGMQPAAKRVGDLASGFSVMLGTADDTMYLFLDVADVTLQRTDAHWPVAGQRDHVHLTLHGRQGIVNLRLGNKASGALIVTDIDGGAAPLRVTGEWLETVSGYAVELALPQGYPLRALAVAVLDLDENDIVRRHDSVSTTGGRPWTVLTHSEALANSLQQLMPQAMLSRVVDRDGWLLAESGSLGDLGIAGGVPVWRRWLYNALLFARTSGSTDAGVRPLRSDTPVIRAALAGDTAVAWRHDNYSQRVILAAAVPVRVGGDVRAAVLLERESDALMRLTDRAFSGLFGTTVLALVAAIGVLLLFAGRLSGRIRRLRNAAENALDRDGRVRAFPVSTARDEIGDLSRSFGALIGEVGVYTSYLRGLSGKLSHEINTPIAIVRTSLENLEADPQAADARVYLERARGGIDRLGALVRAMSEASRIEQAIGSAESETVDLRGLVADCAEGYRPLLAPRVLHVDLPGAPLPFHGAPDLIAQALDKLIDNARSFCPADGWVRIALIAADDGATLSVANSGPPLPDTMRDKLFDSLVSVRDRSGAGVHLGFGLYVVKLITDLHRGRVDARNLPAGDGVVFELHLQPIEPTT